MKTYQARVFGNVFVVENHLRHPLPPRHDLANHSPTGLSWGYSGSGPTQCALAILADALGDDARAVRLYQRFKEREIATRNREQPFEMTIDQVMAAVAAIEKEARP